jgi:hypothetical protein
LGIPLSKREVLSTSLLNEAVSKVFRALASAVTNGKEQIQIIVLDHAPERVWAGIPNVNYVEEWRGGRKLVPLAWLQKEEIGNHALPS